MLGGHVWNVSVSEDKTLLKAIASFPGLPTIQLLITYSTEVITVVHSERDGKCLCQINKQTVRCSTLVVLME